jgi:hypothetical protein
LTGNGKFPALFLPLWFACLLGFGVRSTGALFAASCLVLAPLFASCLVSRLPVRIALAATVALLSTTAGWIIAPHYLCSYAVPAGCIMAILSLFAIGVRLLAGRRQLPQSVTEARNIPS